MLLHACRFPTEQIARAQNFKVRRPTITLQRHQATRSTKYEQL